MSASGRVAAVGPYIQVPSAGTYAVPVDPVKPQSLTIASSSTHGRSKSGKHLSVMIVNIYYLERSNKKSNNCKRSCVEIISVAEKACLDVFRFTGQYLLGMSHFHLFPMSFSQMVEYVFFVILVGGKTLKKHVKKKKVKKTCSFTDFVN